MSANTRPGVSAATDASVDLDRRLQALAIGKNFIEAQEYDSAKSRRGLGQGNERGAQMPNEKQTTFLPLMISILAAAIAAAATLSQGSSIPRTVLIAAIAAAAALVATLIAQALTRRRRP